MVNCKWLAMMGTMMPFSQRSSKGRRVKSSRLRGMTLVELMITVTVAGVLAALASTSFTKQIRQARSAEAVEMLGTMQKAVSVAAMQDFVSGTDLNFATNSFGKGNDKGNSDKTNKDAELDNDGNNGHGDSDGCDPSNPGAKCNDKGSDDSKGNSKKANKDADLDNDGNNGHGNNEGKCDPSNPGKSKDCNPDGGDDSSTGGDDSSTGGDDSSTGGDDSSGDGGGSAVSGQEERLCGSAQPVPSSIDSVAGKKYLAGPSDWSSGSEDAGWTCLRIGRSGSQSYQFGYDVGAGTVGGASEGYTAWARGDLDGDGRTSMFRLRGDVIDGKIVHSPGVEIIDAAE